MSSRPVVGRGLFYTRDSEGHSDLAPPKYVSWAQAEATKLGVTFEGTSEAMLSMIHRGISAEGDLFLDFGISGNRLNRPGFDAFQHRALTDNRVSHLFIPRRDRIARPDQAVDGVLMEYKLRSAGLTLCFMNNKSLEPLARGQRMDLADSLTSLIDYDTSGRFRRALAEKLIYAKIKLAEGGYSIGGEPIYGFRRWLVSPDGSDRRELAVGEIVKRAGYHVLWLPTAEHELAVVHRILDEIETTPAARIAKRLNEEGIPSPKAERVRKVRGIERKVSGLWTQTTVRNIAIHPLLIAVNAYGRRASGDQLRLTPTGPRSLTDADYRPDGQPKVVAIAPENMIRSSARFDPLIEPERHKNILQILEDRGKHLRNKPRARDGVANPLGGRIFDLNCGWPMYRHFRRERWNYQCALYQNSQAKCCNHNVVPGEVTTRFVLSCLRQRVLTPTAMAKLEARLHQLAAAEAGEDRIRLQREAREAEMKTIERRLEIVGRNMALAETPDERQATAVIFGELRALLASQRKQLDELEEVPVSTDPGREVTSALAGLNRLHELAESSGPGPEAAGDLIRLIDARLYLSFRSVERGRRTLSVPGGGALTFGSTSPPGPLYQGPTDRAIIREMLAAGESVTAAPVDVPPGIDKPVPEVGWSANVQRGTRRCSGPALRRRLMPMAVISPATATAIINHRTVNLGRNLDRCMGERPFAHLHNKAVR
jgi:hypothetical protein